MEGPHQGKRVTGNPIIACGVCDCCFEGCNNLCSNRSMIGMQLPGAFAEHLDDAMQAGKLTKVSMAARMSTSRSQLDRVLDPANLSVQLDTLIKAANAVGKTVEIKLRRQSKSRAVAV